MLPTEDGVSSQYYLSEDVDVPPPTTQLNETSLDGRVGSSTQYRISSFSLPNREQLTPQHRYNRYNGPPTQMQGVILDQGWGEKYPARPEIGTANNSHASQIVDTDMSSEQASDRQSSLLSDHQTPLNSRQPSSNTSYSPPTVDDCSHPTITTNGPSTVSFDSTDQFTGFTPTSDTHFPHSPDNPSGQEPNGFTIPAGWEVGADGALHVQPGASTGLSPLGESGWTQILEGMGWDGNGLDAGGEVPWRAETEESRV